MTREVSVTIRVPPELKARIAQIAFDLRISQSAVWKILIARYVYPVTREEVQSSLEKTARTRLEDRKAEDIRSLRP